MLATRVAVSLRAAIIVVLAVAVAGCSAVRFAYTAAPEVSYWWLDGYADFDGQQSPRVREAISQWFAWHRRTQLPDYAALLVRAQAEVMADTTPERACDWWPEVQKRLRAGFEQALPSLVDQLLVMTPAQIAHLEARYAKANREFSENFLQADPAERLKAGVKRGVDRAETVYGRLDDAQRERIAKMAAMSPYDAEAALAERKLRQQEVLAMVRSLAGSGRRDQVEAALRSWAQRLESSPREEHRRYVERLTQFSCAAAAQFHNATTPAQRQTAQARLKGWETDLRALVAEPR